MTYSAFKYGFRTPKKQRSWEYDIGTVLIHLCRFHYCFDYIGLRFTVTDVALGHQVMIKFFYLMFSQTAVNLTIKRRWLVWFCHVLSVVGMIGGF